nr:hypothetical protein [Mammaliicoccus sp. Marseille-Q6498]
MKKTVIIIIGFVLLVMAICVWKMVGDGTIRVGPANDQFEKLSPGKYKVGSDIDLDEGKYGVYAISGNGKVHIDEKEYSLNNDLYKDASKQPNTTKKGILFEESPKIEIKKAMTIVVEGNKDFVISFVKR